MAIDMFLKFSDDKLKGESTDSNHKDEIELDSWSWGAANTASVGSATTGSGAGKVHFSDFNFIKKIDKSSPALLLALSAGSHIDSATLSIRKAGGDASVNYLVVTMGTVFITSYQTAASGEDVLTESVSLAYGTIKFQYQQQDPKTGGKQGGVVGMGWDQIKNVKL